MAFFHLNENDEFPFSEKSNFEQPAKMTQFF